MAHVYVDVDTEVEVDLIREIKKLSRDELEEVQKAVDEKLCRRKGGETVNSISCDQDRAYWALRLLRKGDLTEALWELERAFMPPVSEKFRRRHFQKDLFEGSGQ